jgi:hypothetical protein
MHNPMLAMVTGKMKVRGLRNMGTFAKLFPPMENPDTEFQTPPERAIILDNSAAGSPA